MKCKQRKFIFIMYHVTEIFSFCRDLNNQVSNLFWDLKLTFHFTFWILFWDLGFIVLALTSSHSSSSPGAESNQSNVTCFDIIRSHQTSLLVRRQEVRENSQI